MPVSIVVVLGLVIVAAIIGLDIFFAIDKVGGNTWSEIIRCFAESTPMIPWICGVLSGHFFWPAAIGKYIPLLGQPNSIALLIWTGCIVGIIGLGLIKSGMVFPLWLAFIIGGIGGMFLWPVGKW